MKLVCQYGFVHQQCRCIDPHEAAIMCPDPSEHMNEEPDVVRG